MSSASETTRIKYSGYDIHTSETNLKIYGLTKEFYPRYIPLPVHVLYKGIVVLRALGCGFVKGPDIYRGAGRVAKKCTHVKRWYLCIPSRS